METIYNLKEIESTGYKSWTDFYLKHTSWSEVNEIYTYGYIKKNGEKAAIQLKLPVGIIESLCLEESRIVLEQINLTSFSDLLEKYKSKKGQFEFNVIIRTKNDEILFKKTVLEEDHVIQLSQIEKKKHNYITYNEPKM